ncbi:MAG TPA: 1-deoxy-D-xylulose-5-phosphate reductoisomerase [Chitinophagaceae bacterium]|nr:1-deoxy-D-xylulose-5-phosphate reductoisomerase [Chitinophagaceae bacterium]HNF71331.1 1-deoxy-D-xylulose-5-phosphate reductoisomerase [Chitinophagaceae bacterium]
MKRRIAIYGSTGSIGKQALEVIGANPDRFEVAILTALNNVNDLIDQARIYNPAVVVIGNEKHAGALKEALASLPIEVLAGEKALMDAAAEVSYDIMLSAIVGYAGLLPTLSAIEHGKTIALANKETLVVAGEWVTRLAKEKGVRIIPVDSEHSAIFQCLCGEADGTVEKIILTASGGPFLGKKPNYLINVKKDHALQHPNWSMGAKISIDSASLMNKGLEMIEAKWLFGLKNDQIEVVIHPQSIIHSMVQFCDGSIKAQMGLPDMKLPIQYALGFPERIPNDFKRLLFKNYPTLSFESPDYKTFRNLALARDAMYQGGNAPCILNAANEVAVDAFIKNKLGFLEMSDVIEHCLQKITHIESPELNHYIETNRETRELASSFIK